MRALSRFSPLASLLLAALFAGAAHMSAQPPAPAGAADPLHAWAVAKDPASLDVWVNQRLAAEQADIDKLLAVTGPRTLMCWTESMRWEWQFRLFREFLRLTHFI